MIAQDTPPSGTPERVGGIDDFEAEAEVEEEEEVELERGARVWVAAMTEPDKPRSYGEKEEDDEQEPETQ